MEDEGTEINNELAEKQEGRVEAGSTTLTDRMVISFNMKTLDTPPSSTTANAHWHAYTQL